MVTIRIINAEDDPIRTFDFESRHQYHVNFDIAYAVDVRAQYFDFNPLTVHVVDDLQFATGDTVDGSIAIDRVGVVLDEGSGGFVVSYIETYRPYDSSYTAYSAVVGILENPFRRGEAVIHFDKSIGFTEGDGKSFGSFIRNGTEIAGGGGRERILGTKYAELVLGDAANPDWFLTPRSSDDILYGRGGNDTINGQWGHDILIGGAGRDHFIFSSWYLAESADRIRDFSPADDTIDLDHRTFRRVDGRDADGLGRITGDAFHLGSAAADAEDRILYDAAAGLLAYDRDGTGGRFAPELFARLDHHPALTAADIFVI